MTPLSTWRGAIGKATLAIGIGCAATSFALPAMAGCSYLAPAPPVDGTRVPVAWNPREALSIGLMKADFRQADNSPDFSLGDAPAIVGLWRFSFISDGTAYPTPIPYGAVFDSGTAQWHSDKTEFMISGGRAPSTGDVCMGVWEQTGPRTYKLKHIALAYASSDTPPPVGPVVPAAYVGPAIIRLTVQVNRAGNAYEGTVTLDQYARDETTLLQHIGGKVVGTRFTID